MDIHGLCALILICGAGALLGPELPTVERYALTDAELFAAVDRDAHDMTAVLDAWGAGDVASAKRLLAAHFRTRTQQKWFINHLEPHGTEAGPVENAEKVLRHEFRSHGVDHTFGENINWLENPTYAPDREFDKEWSMAFLRMPWWNDLAAGYRKTGDERYAREFVHQFLDFRAKHPICVERCRGLGSHPLKYTVPEWRTLEVGSRLSGSWMNAFHSFLQSEAFTDDAVCEMLKAFIEMSRYLRKYPSGAGEFTNNWLVYETTALYSAGVLLPEFAEAAQWRSEAADRLVAEVRRQVYPDGSQWELAPGYGAGVLRSFRRGYQIGALNNSPLPADFTSAFESMYSYLLYSSINGTMPAFNDSGHGSITALMADAYADYPEREDFAWAATAGGQGHQPETTHVAFDYAGQYVMRSDWGEQARFMIVDAGPYGVGHQHEDNLSFELWAYGDYLVTDPGTYRYNYDSPWRQFMVSSLSHNTLAVDHLGQQRRGNTATYTVDTPLDHVWSIGEETVYLRAAYDDGYGPAAALKVTHTRTFIFVRNRYWVIIDRAVPADDAEHLYEVLFTLAADSAQADGDTITSTHEDGPALVIAAAPVNGQTVEIVRGQTEPVRRGWRRGGDDVEPNPTAVIAQTTAGPATFATVLYPRQPGAEMAEVSVRIVEQTPARITLAVTTPGDGETLIDEDITEDAVTIRR